MGIIAPFRAVRCLYADVDITDETLANTGFDWFSPIIAYSSIDVILMQLPISFGLQQN